MDLRVCKIISFKFDIAEIRRLQGAIFLGGGGKMFYSAHSSWFLYCSIAD